MTHPPPSNSPERADRPAEDRLDSWKEIATYLRRDVTTVQRWERREGMPVHRHLHDKLGSVYAFRSELDAWARGRLSRQTIEGNRPPEQQPQDTLEGSSDADTIARPAASRRRLGPWMLGAAVVFLVAGFATW